ncbi:stage V sporulation protein D [Mycoplasma sp. CAG:877]|nr:stage V sporulation protein D [Mycoplasma sp. CAG:877]
MFFKKIDERIKITFLVMLILFIFIILRVFYIQVFDYKKLNEYASDLWSRDLPIEANRGLILDRNGVVLADNLTTTSLVLIPNQIKEKEKATEELAKILNVSYDEMQKHVYKKTSIERVHPEGRRLSYDIAEKISNLKLDGVYLVKEAKRYYPYGNLLSHSLGYVGIDNQGLSGLELEYDKYLTGKSGAIKYFSDAKGNKLNVSDVYVEPQDGMNLYLTIDINIQKSIERELDNIVDMFSPDMALAVVMNPKTGEILGMGSRPDYNPNTYQKYSQDVLSRNLPVWSSYEPGSTFKIITMATSVEEKIIDIENDHFYDSGSVNVDGSVLKCWKAGGHGDQTFLQVLQNSCNPGFVKLGQMLGKERLFSYIKKFGFGEKTGVDLNGEGQGILFPLEKVGNVELSTTAFGQGVSVTPIQQVTAVSAVVNGGYLYKPYIVKSIAEKETNTIIQETSKTLVRKVISSETSTIMRHALESVVAKGGGKAAYIEGYRIGGKTGTAQKVKDGRYMVGNYIMSFMSIVPSNDPEAVFYLAIDNPKNTALLSSYTTTPIARRVLLDIIDALDIKPQEEGMEKDLEWTDKIMYQVPNVIGKSVKEAKKLLSNFTIEYSGTGETVISQSPAANTKLEDRGTVRLLLE